MKATGFMTAVVFLLLSTSLAGAQTTEDTGSEGADIVALEAQSQGQQAQIAQQIDEVSITGQNLQETQARADGAAVRSRELERQNQNLREDLESQRQESAGSQALYEEQVRAAYKGDDLEGLIAVVDGVFNSGGGSEALARSQTQRALAQGRQRFEDYRDDRQKLRNTVRQVSQKESNYKESLEEERDRAEELRLQEKRLEEKVSRLREDKSRTDGRIQRLQEAERDRILDTRPATGGPSVQRGRELRIARNDIVARPVKQISKKRYRKLYRQSAKKYGFGEDWYILAAVGKVESDHGENMGPSSAGAMGPMQFMPSTWESSGVDGNGDGTANVMDPEDAIPAAAKYLKTGGAPKDWYAALYSYNHADWYVKKVLGVAEGYRRLAKDKRMGPYT